jgi:hypothetical protein
MGSYRKESSELELGNDWGRSVTVCAFVLSFSINDYSYFCTAISLDIIDVMGAEGELSHISGDTFLWDANPGIESDHAISLLFERFKPLFFTSLCFSKTFWRLDACVR